MITLLPKTMQSKMMKLVIVLILSINSACLSEQVDIESAASGCELSTDQGDSPLVLYSGENHFIYPKNGEKSLTFTSGQVLDLVCPGEKINVASSAFYDNITTATCVSGSTLKVNGKTVAWNKISCSSAVYRVARLTGGTCENNGKEVEIGFEANDIFLRLILICFDETKQQALYSHANITASINQRIKDTPRPNWLQSRDIFTIPYPNDYYLRNNQRKTINSLLGLSQSSTKYIQNNTYFLSRGHMTARSDNFYPAQQNVTFFLLNVAPQWQICNAGNWESVEISVRDYAEANNVDLMEWTGVYGVTTLPHDETGESIELYLYNQDGRQALPVPEFYWKVAYDPKSERGVAIIVMNNPYLETYKPVCADIIKEINWLSWDKSSQKLGYGYVCTVESFRKTVDYLPKFTVKGVLT